MKLLRRKELRVPKTNSVDAASCSASSPSRRDCLDDMLHKLTETKTNIEETHETNIDLLRLKLMMSLSLAEESARTDEGLMKVKRLRSKILTNFVKIDESDVSYVSWNSQNAMNSLDEEVGCEVINHSTPEYNISAIRINELSPESPQYDPMHETFEVKVVSDGFASLMHDDPDVFETGFELSINGKLSEGGQSLRKAPTVVAAGSDESIKSETYVMSSFSDTECSGKASDCLDQCDCGLAETTAIDSYVGIEIIVIE